MKLTGKLKDKVEAVESMAEKKDIIADAGMELTDDELANVAGGVKVAHIPMSNAENVFLNSEKSKAL